MSPNFMSSQRKRTFVQSCWKRADIFSIILLLLSSCSWPSPVFRTDKQMVDSFHEKKSAIVTLISLCNSLKSKGGGREAHTKATDVNACPIDKKYLGVAEIKEVSVDSKSSYYLLMTDLDKDLGGTFYQEKGYAYFPQRTQPKVIESGTLDEFIGKDLFPRKGIQEAWRYKKIEGNWYLYYRQYYVMYLS